ncbi:MAG: HAMP domain-containing sensor histidine kinase [Caldimonas sp.]
MADASNFARLIEFFGAHRVPESKKHLRERAQLRGIACLGIASIWLIRFWSGTSIPPSLWIILALAAVYGGLSFFHLRTLRASGTGGIGLLYAFLILDPLFIIAVLIEDPRTFAFLNPLLLVVILRSGLGYGIRTMYLAWGAALLGATLLATSEFWRSELELTLAFLLTLAFPPIFFSSLIRRIHNIRAIEEERARLIAVHEVSAARSAFLAKVSHELRSPLQSIVSALDVIEMRHGSAFAHDAELIGRMRRSSLLLNTQLRDLLTLANGQAGRLAMHPKPFDACALVEALAEAARGLAVAKGLDVVVELPAGPIFVVADGSRIDQVLTNLVVNSIRYTEAGQVRISLSPFNPSIRRLHFTVADTGPGIPEEALPTLFDPDRIATSADRRGEGSGLGLAIVRTLVEHLGGTIAATSTVGKGTHFEIEFPAEPVATEVLERTPGANSRVSADRF